MANQRDKNKRILGVYMDREIYHRLAKLSRLKKTTVADLTRTEVQRLVKDVVLSEDEKLRIKNEKQSFILKQQTVLDRQRSFEARMDKARKDLEG